MSKRDIIIKVLRLPLTVFALGFLVWAVKNIIFMFAILWSEGHTLWVFFLIAVSLFAVSLSIREETNV